MFEAQIFPPNTEWAVSLGDGIKQRQMRPLRSLVCLSVSSFTIRKREKVVNLIDPKAAARTADSRRESGMDMQNVALLAGFLGAKTALWINTQAWGRPSNGVYDFGKG